MRTLDIAAAITISLMSVASIASMDPSQARGQVSQLNRQIQLQEAIVTVVEKTGVGVFGNGELSDICSALKSDSNATITFSALLDGKQCLIPEIGATVSNLTLSFTGRTVVLEAWSTKSAG